MAQSKILSTGVLVRDPASFNAHIDVVNLDPVVSQTVTVEILDWGVNQLWSNPTPVPVIPSGAITIGPHTHQSFLALITQSTAQPSLALALYEIRITIPDDPQLVVNCFALDANDKVVEGNTVLHEELVEVDSAMAKCCVNSIADLRALSAGVFSCLTLLGYHAPGDGGGGEFYWDALSTEPDNGGTVIEPGSNPAAGRWKRLVDGPLSVKWFGAKGDGQANRYDTAAIQATIKSVNANKGGTVFFPTGVYVCTGQLNLDCSRSIRLQGPGSPTPVGTDTAAVIKYKGIASPFISARSTFGFTIRGLAITYTSPLFTGVLLDLGQNALCGPPPPEGPPDGAEFALIENCLLGGEGASGAAALISLDKAIVDTIRNNVFYWAQVAIRGVASVGSYSNAIQILNNCFLFIEVAAITNAGEAWLIQGNTFEYLVNQLHPAEKGPAGAYTHDPGLGIGYADSVSFIGNWFGDANDQGTWITWSGLNLLVQGNLIGSGKTAVAIAGSGNSGISIISNSFEFNTVGIDIGTGQQNVAIFGNRYDNVTTPVIGTPTSSGTDGAGASLSGPLLLAPGSGTGAPTAGSHQVGELYVNSSGSLFICVVSGIPGSWKQVMTQ